LGIFFNFFGKIQLFELEGIPLLARLAITFGVGYSLWVISILKSNCTCTYHSGGVSLFSFRWYWSL
jgi:hypothetical protein